MSPLWIVPTAIIALGAVALVSLLRGTRNEARALTDEVARFGELHVSLARVRAEVTRSRALAGDLRKR
ncbi:MAG: hypothetical protein JF603_08605 [Acidobacteria bacterium]|nr:hypothetical protein [Acidobacteriota bacterium]